MGDGFRAVTDDGARLLTSRLQAVNSLLGSVKGGKRAVEARQPDARGGTAGIVALER